MSGLVKTTNIFKLPDSNFPEFIKLKISEELVDKIGEIIDNYKSNVKDAVIYSLIENKPMISEQRVSLKTSFHNEQLSSLIYNQIVLIIKKFLNDSYPNYKFEVEIGPQHFDYIKYETDGYFEKHKDWIRINNPNQQQYTLLMGLSENVRWDGGHTILWLPVNDSNRSDYETIVNFEDLNSTNQTNYFYSQDENSLKIRNVLSKYNIPSYSIKCINEMKQFIIEQTSDIKYIPHYFDTLRKGNCLMFKSDIVHSGEKFTTYNKSKELVGCTINITCLESTNLISNEQSSKIDTWLNDKSNPIISFDNFESWMIDWADKNNLVPFQIILNSGKYNEKNFNYNYTKYWNLSNDINRDSESDDLLNQISKNLLEIYESTKSSLNHRGRETHLSSKILDQSSQLDSLDKLSQMKFKFNKTLDNLSGINQLINTFVSNYVENLLINNHQINHKEIVLNRWEESGCNDSGDEYDDQTYLHCDIDIKFCFCKNNA
jgi:hypothetical protein